MPESETLITATFVRVSRTSLAPGEAVEWHHHTEVDDSFYGLVGSLVISTRHPDERHSLAEGETFRVARRIAHRVSNESALPAEYLLVQHGGRFDFHEHH